MTQTVTAAIAGIASVVAGVTGITPTTATPTENYNEYPFAMVYLFDGQVEPMSAGWDIGLLNIAVDVLTPRRDISLDMGILLPVVDSLIDEFMSQVVVSGFFGGTISTFSNLAISFLPMYLYAGVDMIGYRFVLEGVKLMGTRS